MVEETKEGKEKAGEKAPDNPKGDAPKKGAEDPNPDKSKGKEGVEGSHFTDFNHEGVDIVEKGKDPDEKDKGTPDSTKKDEEDPEDKSKGKDGKDSKPEGSKKEPKKDEQLILGRFKTKEDLKKSVRELSKELGNVVREVSQIEKQLGETSVLDDPLITVITEDNLEDSYKDLERRFTKAGQRRAELRKQAEKEPEKTKTKLTPEEEYDLLLKDPDAYVKLKVSEGIAEADKKRSAADVKKRELERAALEEASTAVASFKKEHPDFAEYETEMNTVIEEEIPKNVHVSSAKLLKMAYDIVIGRKTPDMLKKVKEAAENDNKNKTGLTETDAGAGAQKGAKEENIGDKITKDIVNSSKRHPQFG